MAGINENFDIKTGLKVGPTTIVASTGNYTTTGNLTVGSTVIRGASGNIVVGPTTINGSTGAISTTANVTTSGYFISGSTIIGGGSSTFSGATIQSSTINSTPIGGSTPAAGGFTTLAATGVVTISSDIMPTANNVSNIGSATNRFNTIFVNEARLSANTLYLGDTAILGTTDNVINIHADSGQAISMQTTGAAGTMNFVSNAQVTMQTTGNNADVLLQSNGTGSKTRLLSGTQLELIAPTLSAAGNITVTGNSTVNGNFVVSGNLTVSGTTTTVNSTNLAITDNVVIVNDGEAGMGVTAGSAGIQFDRGQLSSYQLVFKEADQGLYFGPVGSTIPMASQSWVSSNYLAGSGTISTVAGEVNRIVKADASGYINNNYYSSTDNSAPSGVTAVMVKVGDNILRSGTSAAISSFLGLANSATTTAASTNTPSTIVLRDGSGNFAAGVITAVSTSARYADLAENYESDDDYAPGTVVSFGGDFEVTLAKEDGDRCVAGIVSTNPAYLMNADQGANSVAVALQGRVPCKVTGKVSKGSMMVAAGNGFARAESKPSLGQVIGKALEAFDGEGEGVIEVVVGRL